MAKSIILILLISVLAITDVLAQSNRTKQLQLRLEPMIEETMRKHLQSSVSSLSGETQSSNTNDGYSRANSEVNIYLAACVRLKFAFSMIDAQISSKRI